MLHAYYDDSGTHANSQFVVVGGLIGDSSQWHSFTSAWTAKLSKPLPGKAPIQAFHLAHVENAHEEFSDYSRAERDAVQHDFRQIITNADLIGIAAAIDLKAWNELVVGRHRDRLGDALGQCACYCIEETIRIAGANERLAAAYPAWVEVEIVFDRGMWRDDLARRTEEYTYPMSNPRIKVIRSMSVKNTPPLQGADTLAYENYRFCVGLSENESQNGARAHFESYLKTNKAAGFFLGLEEIEELLSHPE